MSDNDDRIAELKEQNADLRLANRSLLDQIRQLHAVISKLQNPTIIYHPLGPPMPCIPPLDQSPTYPGYKDQITD